MWGRSTDRHIGCSSGNQILYLPRQFTIVRSISTCSLAHLKTLNGETGEVILGSGQRALAAMPPITRVVLCELQTRTANRLESTLREAYPDRDLVALAGDGNVEIRCYLKTLTVDWRRYAAVFAMVDQYSAEVTWETLKYLSTWRLNRRGFKVELWLYFGHGLLLGLPGLAGRQLSSSAVRSRVSQVRAAWRSPSSSS